MSHVKCNACPSPWDCGVMRECLNCRVTAIDIHAALAYYDSTMAKNAKAREIPIVPKCPHSTKSAAGICMDCGAWV